MPTKSIITFLAGFGIGSIGTWLGVKKYYANIANEEIDSVKEHYKSEFIEQARNLAENEEPTEIAEAPEKEEPNYEDIIRKLNYNEYSQSTVKKEEPVVNESVPKAPYSISPSQFAEDSMYDKITLTYFKGDGVFMNLEEETIPHGTELVGEDNLDKFGEYEEDVLYVRNENEGADYEVILEEGAYADSEYAGEYEE